MKKSIPSTTVPTCSLTFILVHIYGTYVQSNIFMKVYVLQLFSGSDGNLVFIPHDLRAFGLPDITLLLVDQSALLLIPLACCQYCCTCTMVRCFILPMSLAHFSKETTSCVLPSQGMCGLLSYFSLTILCVPCTCITCCIPQLLKGCCCK